MGAIVEFAAFDSSGAPLAGLAPAWDAAWDAVAETVIGSPPAFVELAGGLYKFVSPDGVDLAGFIDLTATASPRYLPVIAGTVGIIPALGLAGAPLSGLVGTMVWDVLRNVETNAPLTPPAFTELGASGLYKFTLPDPGDQAAGIVDLGATASPRYPRFDSSAIGGVPPVINAITPLSGVIPGTRAAALQTPIEFDVTDVDPGLLMVVVTLKYGLDASTLVVHDGSNFLPPFNSAASERTAITDGFHFEVLPAGGWAGDFTMFVYAVDTGGELEGTLP